MSNFVYPAFFEDFHKGRSLRFDHMKTVKYPFQIVTGGYAPVRKARKSKRASPQMGRELRKENRDLHRSEFR